MHAGVDLRVIVGALRHAEQAIDLGQHARERAAAAQHLEHPRRLVFHQAARDLLPDALGHQRVDFAVGDHLAHQRFGLGGDVEVGEARREARQAKDAHRVLGECRRDMAQHLGIEVAPAAVRIDQRAALVLGDRVDGEVAAGEIVLERHAAVGVELEAVIAGAGLSLGPRERMLLARVGMEEHREVAADREIAEGEKLAGIGADDDPVAISDGATEQSITNRTAHEISLHRCVCYASLRLADERSVRSLGRGMRSAAPETYSPHQSLNSVFGANHRRSYR